MSSLHQQRTAALAKRRALICQIIAMEAAIERIAHTIDSFEKAYDQLNAMPSDLLDAIEHACLQTIARQNEAGYCEPVEIAPDTFDELYYILATNKITL